MGHNKNVVEAVLEGKTPTAEVEDHTKLGRGVDPLEGRKTPHRDLDGLN